ncbi:MAG: hypothetical protein DGJ47_000554 [Rickettsiaceae bacterium]
MISIETNIKEVSKNLDHLQRKQLPFASSKALNKIAVKSQDEIIKMIPTVFNNRKKWYGKNQKTGVKVRFSNKYELVAAVFTRAYFAKIQEEGGVKLPYSGNSLAVPMKDIARRFYKSNALKKERDNGRIFKSRSGRHILRRVGKKQVKKLYSLVPHANVRARFGFVKTAHTVFHRRFEKIFYEQLEYALKTAKW